MSQIPLYYEQAQQQPPAQQPQLPSLGHHPYQQPLSQPHLQPPVNHHHSRHIHPQQYPGHHQPGGHFPQPVSNDNNGNGITLPSISQASRHGSQNINPVHLPPTTHFQPLKAPQQSAPVNAPIATTQASNSTSLRRGPWSPEEDRKLLDAINIFGATNWVRISQSLGSRTPKQCRERYHQNLKPSLNRNPITNEEGALIEELVQRYGKRWAEIARHLNGRSDNAIKNWWNGGSNRRRRASSQAILEAKSMHPEELQPLTTSEPMNHHHSQSNNDITNSSNNHTSTDPDGPTQQILPPPDQFQKQWGVKRFLEEQHFPQRRHSAQTILTSDSAPPVSNFNFNANGGSSRNSLVSLDYSNNTSRRSSLVFDYANNPNNAYRKSSMASTHSTSSYLQSPVFGGQRNSIVGGVPNLTPLSPMLANSASSQQSTGSSAASSQQSVNSNLFKKDFTFNKPLSNNQIKLPGPTSIPSNQNFLQPPRVQSELSETHIDSQPPIPTTKTIESINNVFGVTASHSNDGTQVPVKQEDDVKLKAEEQEKESQSQTNKEDIVEQQQDKQKVMNISNLLG